MLRTEDFNDDKKDAGEIGAGHTVTALYEIVPAGKKVDVAPVDDLKYQQPVGRTILSVEEQAKNETDEKTDKIVRPTTESSNELLTLKMRYKAPDGDTSKKLEWPVTDEGKSFSAATPDCQFAAAVAGFGLVLRDSQYKGNLTFGAVREIAQAGIGEDKGGYRKEFLGMVDRAKELRHE
jgi:Ca-activated chloride channel family protein